MSSTFLNPTHVAHPAAQPPPILPWNGFDASEVNDRSLAVRLIAEILQDDEWHHRNDVIDEVVDECGIHIKGAAKLLSYLRSHGDVRFDGEWVRLTTRWQNWAPETVT